MTRLLRVGGLCGRVCINRVSWVVCLAFEKGSNCGFGGSGLQCYCGLTDYSLTFFGAVYE